MESEDHKVDLEDPEGIIDEITGCLDRLHKDLVNSAVSVGKEKEKMEAIRPIWKGLAKASVSDPGKAEIYTRGVLALSALRDQVTGFESEGKKVARFTFSLNSATNSTAVITGSTAQIVQPIRVEDVFIYTPTFITREETISRLKKLDPTGSLSKTYRSIQEVLYGTRSSPERAALYLDRQYYDHFFNILAPDKWVRKSAFWHKKKGKEPNLVTRLERINYALDRYVKDPLTSERLRASADHMLAVYRALNQAHQRGELDAPAARTALLEMDTLIEDWLKAIYV
jgi:Predicted pPIWI-associating nuclease